MKLQIESVIRSLWTLLHVPCSVVIPPSPDSPCRFHFTAYHKIDLAAVFRVRFERSGPADLERGKGANQPREEFLLFIASILGAAAMPEREREREKERLRIATATDGGGTSRTRAASNSEGRNGPPINLQNKTFYEATPTLQPIFLLPWLWPARPPLWRRRVKKGQTET